jgi:hypothetical protein
MGAMIGAAAVAGASRAEADLLEPQDARSGRVQSMREQRDQDDDRERNTE